MNAVVVGSLFAVGLTLAQVSTAATAAPAAASGCAAKTTFLKKCEADAKTGK